MKFLVAIPVLIVRVMSVSSSTKCTNSTDACMSNCCGGYMLNFTNQSVASEDVKKSTCCSNCTRKVTENKAQKTIKPTECPEPPHSAGPNLIWVVFPSMAAFCILGFIYFRCQAKMIRKQQQALAAQAEASKENTDEQTSEPVESESSEYDQAKDNKIEQVPTSRGAVDDMKLSYGEEDTFAPSLPNGINRTTPNNTKKPVQAVKQKPSHTMQFEEPHSSAATLEAPNSVCDDDQTKDNEIEQVPTGPGKVDNMELPYEEEDTFATPLPNGINRITSNKTKKPVPEVPDTALSNPPNSECDDDLSFFNTRLPRRTYMFDHYNTAVP